MKKLKICMKDVKSEKKVFYFESIILFITLLFGLKYMLFMPNYTIEHVDFSNDVAINISSTNTDTYNEAPVDITTMDIFEIQEAIDNGYLTYELLIRLYLDRITAYDDKYNAIISINENAIEEAKECDKKYQESGRDSILFCIPIIVKDNIDVKGMATTVGTETLADSYPYNDSFVISKLKEQGMIVLAKSNMSEFAFLASSSTSSYGTVKNAYNLDYSSYGSSGGSAVAVAVGYAPVALGTDTNSSLRVPASANSVIGFRSTFGLIDTAGIVAYDITRDVVGPITKTVTDNALILETIAEKPYGTYSNLADSTLEGKTIAVLDQFAYGDSSLSIFGTGTTYIEITKLFDDAINKMQASGATIIHLDDFYNYKYYYIYQNTLAGWTMCYAFNNYIKNTSSYIDNFEMLTYSSGHIYSLYDYLLDCDRDLDEINQDKLLKEEYINYVENIITQYNIDAFVYPTTKTKVANFESLNFESSSYTIAPVLGYPSVSVPLGFDKDGLSYGIEFVSNSNNESKLYEIIYAYEKINNVYKLPEIAPSLYEIPEEVELLKQIYEENKDNKINHYNNLNDNEVLEYNNALQEIKYFFLDYNSYDNKSETATILYTNYNEAITNLNNSYALLNNNASKIIYDIVIAILVLCLVILIMIILIKKVVNQKPIS